MGYMQTLITQIHCICFSVVVLDYQSHTSILLYFSIIQPLQAFSIFYATLHETLKRDHAPFPIDPEFQVLEPKVE